MPSAATAATVAVGAAATAAALRWLSRRQRAAALMVAWERDGYVVVPNLLTPAECARLEEAVTSDGGIETHAHGRDDGMGRRTRMALWNHPGCDVCGMIARIPRVRHTMETLLGGECYHYHSKLMMKDARTGGAHLWHQDFGYWCNNGCVFPHMGTAFIPLDRMDGENAGLKVIRGSHKLGLVPHGQTGAQAEADPQRREWALAKGLEEVQLTMNPGDCLFFHCLTLHAAGAPLPCNSLGDAFLILPE